MQKIPVPVITYARLIGLLFLLSVNQLSFSQQPHPAVKNKTPAGFDRVPAIMQNAPQMRLQNAGVLLNQLIKHTSAGVQARSSVSQKNATAQGNLTLNLVATGTTCGYNNGSIKATTSGGVPPYLYSLNSFNYQTGDSYNNLVAGSYSVKVTDAAGDTAKNRITLTNTYNAPFGSLFFYENPSGCSAKDASITLAASGGTPPYTYSLDLINFQSSNLFDHLASGRYYSFVKDANGCIGDIPAVPVTDCAIGFGGSYSPSTCDTGGTIHIIESSGGTAPYQYSVDGRNFKNDGYFPDLSPGIHTFYIMDAKGLTLISAVQIFDYCQLLVTANPQDASCGNKDGSITVIVSNGKSPYQYSLDGLHFQNSNIFPQLAAGNYTVTVKDSNANVNTVNNIAIASGCISVSAVSTNATCDNNNGSITATANGGTKPYLYSMDNTHFQSSAVFTQLSAGNYVITVKDGGGNTSTTNIQVNNTPGPSINVSFTPASCNVADGSLSINATGGSLPLQYSLDSSAYQPANIFKNLPAKSYAQYVKDAIGCTVSLCCTVITSNCLSVASTYATCGKSDGTITANGSNGTAPYSYSMDGIHFQNGNTFIKLAAGNYTVTSKDANAVINTTIVTIHSLCLLITDSVTDESCGKKNGGILLTVANGKAPYAFSIDGINYQSSNRFTNLDSGTYTVTVKDAEGTPGTTIATIHNSAEPAVTAGITAVDCANHDGSISAIVNGDIAPFQYDLNNLGFQSSPVFNNLDTGAYTLTIKDETGCSSSLTVTVPFNNNLQVDAGADTSICEGTSFTLNASSNGNTFRWTPFEGLDYSYAQNPLASPVISTKYYLTASTDLCSATDSITVLVNAAPVANAGHDTTICNGTSIELNGSGGVQYAWSPVSFLTNAALQNPVTVNLADTITYALIVTDEKGCQSTKSSTVVINVNPPAIVFAGNDTAVAFNQPLQLNAADINHAGFTNYTWSPPVGLDNPFIQNPVAAVADNVLYTVTAGTANGCIATDAIQIKAYAGPEIYVPSAFTPNADGLNDVLKAVPVGMKLFKNFTVYNRFGQKVFYTGNASEGWDGKVNGRLLQPGTFVWMASGVDYNGKSVTRQGTVVLIR